MDQGGSPDGRRQGARSREMNILFQGRLGLGAVVSTRGGSGAVCVTSLLEPPKQKEGDNHHSVHILI